MIDEGFLGDGVLATCQAARGPPRHRDTLGDQDWDLGGVSARVKDTVGARP